MNHYPSRGPASAPRTRPRAVGALFILLGFGFLSVACDETPGNQPSPGARARAAAPAPAADVERTPVHIDSTFPIEEELRRFRQGLEEPEGLDGGLPDRDVLVEALIRRLEAADSTGVGTLALDRAEFAWAYYPHTMYMSRPYELPPALVWFQLQNRSSQGLRRLLGAYAGKTLYYTGYDCPDDGERFGTGWIWHGCTVSGRLPSGDRIRERLFGSILTVDGHYKFVSFSNDR